jgi:glucosamine-6-phosphate deaminase
MKIISTPDYKMMSKKAAGIISAQVILRPDCVLGLATGSTPEGIYSQLIEWYKNEGLDFSDVHSINLDEYCGLTPDHDQSYRYFMNEKLFKHININIDNTNVPNGMAKDMDAECKRYDNVIKNLGEIDLQLLGIGNTGHIGFNEPDDVFYKTTHCVKLKEKTIEANSRFFDKIEDVPKTAVTMGIQSIMQSKKILLAANGAGKAQILYTALFGPITPKVPASILQLHNDLTVVADEAALAVIKEKGLID